MNKKINPFSYFTSSNYENLNNKDFESRLYIILYTTEDGNKEYRDCIGRLNTYCTIKPILDSHNIEPSKIKVLVEVIVREKDSDMYKWAIIHPDDKDSMNAVDFCNSVNDRIDDEYKFDISSYIEISEETESSSDNKSEENQIDDFNVYKEYKNILSKNK